MNVFIYIYIYIYVHITYIYIYTRFKRAPGFGHVPDLGGRISSGALGRCLEILREGLGIGTAESWGADIGNWKIAMEITSFPMKHGDSNHSYVMLCERLPEGIEKLLYGSSRTFLGSLKGYNLEGTVPSQTVFGSIGIDRWKN